MWLDPCLLIEIALEIRSNLINLSEEIVLWLVTRREKAFLDGAKFH
jgi:hypothetical protein